MKRFFCFLIIFFCSFGFSRENGRSQSPVKLGTIPETGGRESPRDRNNGIIQNGRTKQPLQHQQPLIMQQQHQQQQQQQMYQRQQQQQQQQHHQQQQLDDVRNGGSRYNNTSGKISRLSRVSPDSQSDRIAATDSGPPPSVDDEKIDLNSEFPDYVR